MSTTNKNFQHNNTHENFVTSVFKNSFKKEDKQPDYTGNLEIEGKPYKIAMWERKDKNGNPYFSLSFSPNNYVKKDDKTSSNKTTEDSIGDNPFESF